MMSFNSFDRTFNAFGTIFAIAFVLILGVIIFSIVRGVSTWSKNNRSPRLRVAAKVAAKRMEVSGGGEDSCASTSYYATFEVESGDRMEFAVSGQEYGMLVEDDLGILSFQGTRYISFERR